MRVLIIGCGYVGMPLGVELVRLGHEVFGVRRSVVGADEMKAAGILPLITDITKRSEMEHLSKPFDWIVNLVSSGKGGAKEYRDIFLNGTRNLIEWLSEAPPRRFVYTSSTSVYGQTDGSLVKETSPVEPQTEIGNLLVETEQLLLAANKTGNFPAVILRVAGIYGPGRGHLFQQYLKDEARISGKGERLINMIHRDDLIGIILAALKDGRPGEIYNAVDDEPVPQIHFFRWLSETLGKWMPPFASGEEDTARKRSLTHKKVSNRKLRMELSYRFKYPTFRQGYTAEIIRLEKAGELDLKLEPR
jgi:nucleoside-diphosphate-sugar epimerase